jgi:hypothetical protein
MGLSHAPRVITDGLVLGLDAANTRSYGGSGTTWTDLIGSNNGTLINGPVFTQEPKQEPFGGAGAVYFDGTGDYLSVADGTDFTLGTDNFTLECWVYLQSDSLQIFLGQNDGNLPTSSIDIRYSSGTITAYAFSGNSAFSRSGSAAQNSWHHIAWVRDGSAMRLFINGTQTTGTSNISTNSINDSSEQFGVGACNGSGGYKMTGYLSNVRLVKGRALYTSNFTPPRKKLEATSDTVLLTCEKGTIRDRSPSAHAITINGDAKSISGASYFKFDGTNDYVSISSSNDFAFGTSDFSIELWAYFQGSGSYENIFDFRPTSTNGNYPLLARDSVDGDLYYYVNSSRIIDNVSVSNNRWYHIVICREGTTTRFYLNGEIEGSATDSTNYITSNALMGSYSGGGNYFNGKISDVKMYKAKGLTAAEVEQNFNALRGRYGI